MTSSGAAMVRTGDMRVVVGGEEGGGERHVCAAWGVIRERGMGNWFSCHGILGKLHLGVCLVLATRVAMQGVETTLRHRRHVPW